MYQYIIARIKDFYARYLHKHDRGTTIGCNVRGRSFHVPKCENLRGSTTMQTNKTITINGRAYDAVTGLLVSEAKKAAPPAPVKPAAAKKAPAAARQSTPSAAVHSQTQQRSKVLYRRATKKPANIVRKTVPGRSMDIAKSGGVTRFAAHPASKVPAATAAATPQAVIKDIAPKTHPLARKAAQKVQPVQKPAKQTSKQIKDAHIAKALAAPSAPKLHEKKKGSRGPSKWLKRSIIIVGTFVLLGLGFYLAYTNIPSISVSVAASQAGVAASYPKYTPDGYRLDQPVTYSDGEVVLSFISNSADNGYKITQTRSSWDSSAVLENIVRKSAGDNYIQTKERGLTIYSYDKSVAWVNGGILYVIESGATLSGDAIRKIATSL